MATTSAITKEKVIDAHDIRPAKNTASPETKNNKIFTKTASPPSTDGEAAESSGGPFVQEPTSESLEHIHADHRLMRAARFLCHPSTGTVSSSEKDSYLQRKGYSKDEISRAKIYATSVKDEKGKFDRIWGTETKGTSGSYNEKEVDPDESMMNAPISHKLNAQGYYPPGNVESSENPELPNVIVPMAIGGVIVMFGMAAFRWLNGGDFVLFPPSANISGSDAKTGNDSSETKSLEHSSDGLKEQDYLGEDGNAIADRLNDNDEHDEEEYFDNVPGIGQQSSEIPQSIISQDAAIAQNLQSLTMAIEKQTLLQEQDLKEKSHEKARSKTNTAMDLLLTKRSRDIKLDDKAPINLDVSTHFDGENKYYPASQMAVLVQLTEMKCALKTVAESHLNTSNEIVSDGLLIQKLEKIHLNLEAIKMHICSDGLAKVEITAHNERDSKSLKHEENIPLVKEIISSKNMKDEDSNEMKPSPTKEIDLDADQIPESSEKAADESTTSGNELYLEELECDAVDQEEKQKLQEQENERIGTAVGKEALQEALRRMKENNAASLVKASCQMLSLYISNLASNPALDRYSKIYTKNNTFKNMVGRVSFAKDVLIAIGFEEEKSCLRWKHASNNSADGTHDSANLVFPPLLQEAISLIHDLQNQLKAEISIQE